MPDVSGANRTQCQTLVIAVKALFSVIVDKLWFCLCFFRPFEKPLDGKRVRILLTTGQFCSKHGQAFRTGFIQEFVFVRQIHTMNTNSSMKPVRNAWPGFEPMKLSRR